MMEVNWIVWIFVIIAGTLLIFNLYQLVSAYRKKKEAQKQIKVIDAKIEVLRKELEKEKAELENRLRERVKGFFNKEKK